MKNGQRTILVVDDEPKIRTLLRRCLEADGYAIVEAENQIGVMDTLSKCQVDLITLDLQLGAENGLHIATAIRETSQIPIVMVTGKDDVIDKVVGLEVGADDYIAKPFHIREVQARIRSVLRRHDLANSAETPTASTSEQISFNGWQANPETYELITPDGEQCELTTTDFHLLLLFLNAPKRVLSRDQIMDQLNGQEWTPYDRTVDNQVARLRKKIEIDASHPQIIKTVRGVGYIFASTVERSGGVQ